MKHAIHGIILLDKPTGISSNKALQIIKHRFNAQKAGHTGALDPLATGLLPICFGQATKVSEYLLGADKQYSTLIKLGASTDTYDSDGRLLKEQTVDVSQAQLDAALTQFIGTIEQVPPMYSALKKDGQPLYKRARKGEVIERPARTMHVYALTAERVDELHVRLKVHCSSGFYIRSLAHDLGQVLGCGAHVVELRRTAIKKVLVEQAWSLEQIQQADLASVLQAVDCLIDYMPKCQLNAQQTLSLSQGKSTYAEDLAPVALARLYHPDNTLFAIGEVQASGQIKTHKIFML